jgi:hypothetical protein
MSKSAKLAALVPMALLVVFFVGGCDRTITVVEESTEPQSCFGCHDDQNTILVAADLQWQNSFHASGLNIDRGASPGCAGCHIGEGFVQRTKGEPVTAELNPTVIHCFTCHQPHTAGDFSLRWTEPPALANGVSFDLGAANLCVACHQARRDVNTFVGDDPADQANVNSSHWGPHYSVQGDMLIGSNGYEYNGYDYENTAHRAATDDGCLDCHYKATSNNIVGGHSFNMRATFRDEGGDPIEHLNTAACETCHENVDDFNLDGVQDEVDTMLEDLAVLLEAAGLLHDGHPDPSAGPTGADSAGALWNFLVVMDDRSRGVHNPDYIKGLLESSIMFLEGTLSPGPDRAALTD